MMLAQRPLKEPPPGGRWILPIKPSWTLDEASVFERLLRVSTMQLREPMPRDLCVPYLDYSDDEL